MRGTADQPFVACKTCENPRACTGARVCVSARSPGSVAPRRVTARRLPPIGKPPPVEPKPSLREVVLKEALSTLASAALLVLGLGVGWHASRNLVATEVTIALLVIIAAGVWRRA